MDVEIAGKVMGLDVGDVRIGVALSDPMGIVAQPLTTIIHKSKWDDVAKIHELIERHQVHTLVVGLPKNMNNTIGPQGKKVQKFVRALQHNYPIEVAFIDERLTTVSAHRSLIESGMRRKDRKEVVDQVAAVYILQTYLDRKEGNS